MSSNEFRIATFISGAIDDMETLARFWRSSAMTVQISSEAHLPRSPGWHEANYLSDTSEFTGPSVLVVLPSGVAISEAALLSKSLEQLEFRVTFFESGGSINSGRSSDSTLSSRWPLPLLDDIDGCNSVISFGSESLHVLTRSIPRLRASVHVGAATPALGEIISSLNRTTESGRICSTDRIGARHHKALLLDIGSVGSRVMPTDAVRLLDELSILQVDRIHHTRPYADPLIIELARRHLSMWS